MHEAAVFLGPTLSAATARSLLDARYLPPIRRGDLANLGPEIRCVGIVDGEFYQSLAVSPKEILPLLERGVSVFGSSSMGALRAAELWPYGMVGVGRIFEAYRDGVVDADDEVAVIYDPKTFRPLSDPLINIRFALEEAVQRGRLSERRAGEALAQLRAIYFPGRSFRLVSELCPELGGFPEQNRPDQKGEDARLLLHAMRAAVPGYSPAAAGGGAFFT